MYGRYSKGLFLERFGGSDAHDLGSWYLAERLPDVIATGWVERGWLYQGLATADVEPPYLAVYETNRWDMEDMLEEFEAVHRPEWVRRGREHPGLEIHRSQLLRRCGPPVPVERSGFMAPRGEPAEVTGMLVVWSRCRAPDREKAFHNWYNRRFVPAQVAAGTFHTAYRYATAFREPDGQRHFAALYETGLSDPAAGVEDYLSEYPAGAPGVVVPDYADLFAQDLYEPMGSVP